MKPFSTCFFSIAIICLLSCSKSSTTPSPAAPVVKPDTLTSGWTKNSNVITNPGIVYGGDIFFIDLNVGYTGTTYSSRYKTTDGGNTWFSLANTFGTSNIAVTPNNKAFFMRDNFDSITRTTDGGLTFSNTFAYGSHVSDIFFSDNNTGICSTESSVLLTTNGGDNWSNISSLPKIDTMTNKSSVVAVKNNCAWIGYNKYIYHSNDNFVTWQLDSIPNIMSNIGICSISAPSSSVIYAVSYTGYLFKSTDGGNSFSFIKKLDAIYNTNIFSDVHFITSTTGFMSVGSRIYKTIDGGNNWDNVVALGNTDIIEIHFVDAQHGWAICFDGSILKFN